uniref:Uncharacterized protein n=1 Tax=Zea mays TaxID=4577 RepID=A0A804P5F6_MAIZE
MPSTYLGEEVYPDGPELLADLWVSERVGESPHESVLSVGVPGAVPLPWLLEVVGLAYGCLLPPPRDRPGRQWRGRRRLPQRRVPGRVVVHLLVPVHEVHGAVVVVVVVRAARRVDGQHQVVGTQPVALRVGVGEHPALQHLVVRVVDPWHHQPRAERQLLVLVEEVVHVPVQHQPPHGAERQQVLRPRLGVVQRVEVVLLLRVRLHHLHVQRPLREAPRRDGVVQVLRRVAVVPSPDQRRLLVRQDAPHAARRLPVELDVLRLPRRAHERVRVHAEPFHVAVVGRHAHVVEEEEEGVQALGEVRQEVEHPPVLLHVRPRVGLERVDHVGELDAVADEEDGEVVAQQVPVALAGVELHGEPARVADRLRGPPLVDHRREAHDHGRPHAGRAQEVGARQRRHVVGALEEALGGGPARVHHALRDALAREVRHLLDQVVVLQQDGTARPHSQRLVVVPHRSARVRRRHRRVVAAGRTELQAKSTQVNNTKQVLSYESQIKDRYDGRRRSRVY